MKALEAEMDEAVSPALLLFSLVPLQAENTQGIIWDIRGC